MTTHETKDWQYGNLLYLFGMMGIEKLYILTRGMGLYVEDTTDPAHLKYARSLSKSSSGPVAYAWMKTQGKKEVWQGKYVKPDGSYVKTEQGDFKTVVKDMKALMPSMP